MIRTAALILVAGSAVAFHQAFSHPAPPQWVPLQSLAGYAANEHTLTQTSGAITAIGRAGHDPYPYDSQDWLGMHAVYWLVDGSVHEVADFTDGGTDWHPTHGLSFSRADGRLTVYAVNVAFAEHMANGGTYQDWAGGPKFKDFAMTDPAWATPADFNGDGVVNTQDFTAFLNAWNAQKGG